MVHQRLAHFERVRHAGAIHFGVDVADQIRLQVQVLDQRQRVVGLRASTLAPEHFDRVVAGELRLEGGVKSARRMPSRKIDMPWKYASTESCAQRLERRLCTQVRAAPSRLSDRRCPSSPNIGRRRPSGIAAPHPFFGHVQAIAPIAAEILVAAIAGQRHGDMPPRKLAHTVGRNGRAVGIRLVVEPRKIVDQVEVVAFDAIHEMPGAIPLAHLLRDSAIRRTPDRRTRSSRC